MFFWSFLKLFSPFKNSRFRVNLEVLGWAEMLSL